MLSIDNLGYLAFSETKLGKTNIKFVNTNSVTSNGGPNSVSQKQGPNSVTLKTDTKLGKKLKKTNSVRKMIQTR